MQPVKFNVATLDESVEGAVPIFEAMRDSLEDAIEVASKLIQPFNARLCKFHIMTKSPGSFEQIKLATVYWDDNVSDVSVVTFPLALEKIYHSDKK